MRKIKVFTQLQGGIREIDTQANTWGELKTELSSLGLITSDMKPLVKETQSSFESDSAPLPEGLGKDVNNNSTHDFTLFLTATKTKSGNNLNL